MEPEIRILVVDDEHAITILISRILQQPGYRVKTAESGREALDVMEEFSPNIVITDLKMPDMNGIELMRKVKEKRPEIDFILLTAFATVENAVQAMKEGAQDYLIKPLKDPDELRIAVSKILERQALLAANRLWQNQLSDGLPPADVLFAGMERIWDEIKQVAKTGVTVLLLGESGTGKSLIAKAIHSLSERKGPFVELNCAAIPETLIESELFGHERGAFTGAIKTKQGKFELAQEGTIFLDEIGEMPIGLQSKLLRVLQERSFERVGGVTTLTTTARVIAATNQDLLLNIKERRFREDLYYRLNVFPIALPPLRQRIRAMPTIAGYMIQTISAKVGVKPVKLTEESIKRLQSYSWPGNIRELHNVLERAIILNQGLELLLPAVLWPEPKPKIDKGDTSLQPGPRRLKSLEELEKDAIEEALKETGGHRRKAAEILGISLRTLQYKLKQYQIET
ncbi:MAG: sigma-54-dependent transcriptional regulator [Dissulfurimicrobium sp.]|uniref:sigma-54-dependent transcriptional regulator n=1 Tax=Dissulfurimicrobium TaxID=1769732 RepID=UPI001EDC6F7C|nr:sigma-54 dependent transcriptional regulator [Dissulfurimicrobium hydrothermale]UKL13019.1 sigma-54 dependent transcriptional regulator [Dissulfurimicrobium hydrothermale]